MPPNVRRIVVLTLVVWAVCALAWIGAVASEQVLPCPEFTPGSSDSGSSHWQWFPPGAKCTYAVYEADSPNDGPVTTVHHVDSPPVARIGILAVLILWPA